MNIIGPIGISVYRALIYTVKGSNAGRYESSGLSNT